MGKCPKGYSLDRIDNAKGYSPTNCRWAHIQVQANNKARSKTATLNGITKPVAVWRRELGLPKRAIEARIYTRGWTPELALTTPIRKTKRRY